MACFSTFLQRRYDTNFKYCDSLFLFCVSDVPPWLTSSFVLCLSVEQRDTPVKAAISGAFAGGVSVILFQGIDVVKSRMQVRCPFSLVPFALDVQHHVDTSIET